MASTRTTRQKQAAIIAFNSLSNAGILKLVLTFLPGHYLFVGAVCREWEAVHAGTANQQVSNFSLCGIDKLVTCGTKTTLFSAAVASPATARLACESGLQICTDVRMQKIAGEHADTQTMMTLRELGTLLSQTLLKAVVLSRRLHVLQYLLVEQHCPRPKLLSHYAARSGSISMLNWLRCEGYCEFNQSTCRGAAEEGHLAALKHLRSEGCDWDVDDIARCAARGGCVEMVEWLLQQQQGIVIDDRVLASAAGAGQIAMCEYLHSIGCVWDADVCYQAARNGHVDTLRWLRENGCPWQVKHVFRSAARNNYTDILAYITEQSKVLSAELLTNTLNCAGAHGRLQVAQWLRLHGVEWPAVQDAVEWRVTSMG
jgi:hypothetical protein